jgi:hypothetical protein
MHHIEHIWPTVKEMSEDLGIPYTTVHSWARRGRIPADHDLDLIEAAARRGKSLTLAELAAARRAAVTRIEDHPPANVDSSAQLQPPARKRGAA